MQIPSLKYVFDRKHRAGKDKKGTVDLRMSFDKRQKFIGTGVRVFPYQWDAKREQVIGLCAAEYNTILAEMKAKVLRIISNMTQSGRIDIDAIPQMLKQEGVDMTFLDYVYKRMSAKKVTEHTHRSYVTLLNKLWEFGKIKYFSDITQKNIRAFHEWLHAYERETKDAYGKILKKPYTQATIYKLTSNLSLFISDAVVDGYISENPYVTKRMNEDKGGTRIDQYLTREEVKMIEEAKMPSAAIAEARDLFLLQCLTGLSYIDLMTYDFTRHRETAGQELCSGQRHKTGVDFYFVLTDKARALLERYDYHMPKMPNQKYNYKLKVVADASGLDKPITSHMGRRTAGSVWLNSGIPIEVVSKCLGHSSIAMTQRAYAKILDTTIVDAFKKLK
jgi:integrase